MGKALTFVLLILGILSARAQPTVGLQTYNPEMSEEGLTLFDPMNDTVTYLIDNCGKLVHTWHSNYRPGNSVYLLENGNLLRTCRGAEENIAFDRPGAGGRVEILDWDSNVLWSYLFSNDTLLQHHDIEPLPNGNILVLAWDLMTFEQAIAAGRREDLLPDSALWPEQVIEVELVGSDQINEVWRWRFQNHLIQDFDASKDNFGVVSDHPELVDINQVNTDGDADWIHANSVAYNHDRDEIVISSRTLSEVFVIDHSTTTAEAATHSGGAKGKGGDFLYRWGNPENFGRGTANDRTLFGQHDVHWIQPGHLDEGKLIIFNNGRNRTPFEYTSVEIIDPPLDMNGGYTIENNSAFGPIANDWEYQHLETDTFFASFISGAEQLRNGNVLICDGPAGTVFEVTPTGELAWEYIVPVNGNGPIQQGVSPNGNLVFRARRYPLDYPGLVGDLTPGDPIEANPSSYNCTVEYLSVQDSYPIMFDVYPNPTTGVVNVAGLGRYRLELIDLTGKIVLTRQIESNTQLDLSHLSNGIYNLRIQTETNETNRKICIIDL